MPPPDPVGARFTTVSSKAGHYESFYLRLCHPDRPLGAWIRCTVHKRPGAAPKGVALVQALRWDLRFASAEAPLFHLPASLLYRCRAPSC